MAVVMVAVVGGVLWVGTRSPHANPRRRVPGPSRRTRILFAAVTAGAACRFRVRLPPVAMTPSAVVVVFHWSFFLEESGGIFEAQGCNCNGEEHKYTTLKGASVVSVVVVRHFRNGQKTERESRCRDEERCSRAVQHQSVAMR